MTISVAEISAAQLAAYNADIPMLVGKSSVASAAAWTQGGSWANTDDSHAIHVALNAFNEDPTDVTTTTAVTSNSYLMLDFGSGTEATFDSIILSGINLYDLGSGNHDVQVDVCDDSTFGVGSQPVAKWTILSTSDAAQQKLVCFTLGDSNNGSDPGVTNAGIYSSVRYARIKIAHSGTAAPEIGCAFFGTRYHMPVWPDIGFDPDQYTAKASVFSAGGLDRNYEVFSRRKVVNATYTTGSAAENALLTGWFAASNYGERLSSWSQSPLNDTTQTYFMTGSASWSLIHKEGTLSEANISLLEVPTFVADEVQESFLR